MYVQACNCSGCLCTQRGTARTWFGKLLPVIKAEHLLQCSLLHWHWHCVWHWLDSANGFDVADV